MFLSAMRLYGITSGNKAITLLNRVAIAGIIPTPQPSRMSEKAIRIRLAGVMAFVGVEKVNHVLTC